MTLQVVCNTKKATRHVPSRDMKDIMYISYLLGYSNRDYLNKALGLVLSVHCDKVFVSVQSLAVVGSVGCSKPVTCSQFHRAA